MPRRSKEEVIDFMELLEEKFSGTIAKKEEKVIAIPTGSISLDVSLGVGGIPLRRFTEIYGAEGSGKTTLALSIAKNAIKQGKKVFYADPEQGLDLGRTEQLIGEVAYDMDKFILAQPETMEETLYLCEKAVASNEFGLIILDSIASMAPREVKEKDLDDYTMGIIARRMGVFMTRNLYKVSKNDVAFVGVNQVRDKFGARRPTFDTPGGHQWKHDCSIRIMLSKVAEITKGGEKTGIEVKFVVKKNKVAPPFRTYSFPMMFDTGVDSSRDLIDFATYMGVIKKRSSYFVFDDITLGQGTVKSIAFLEDEANKETLDKILEQCYNLTNQLAIEDEEEEYYEEESED